MHHTPLLERANTEHTRLRRQGVALHAYQPLGVTKHACLTPKKTVLVLDDEEIVRNLMLREDGYRVLTAPGLLGLVGQLVMSAVP